MTPLGKCAPMSPELEAALEKAKAHVMTAEERRAQRISFIFGLQDENSTRTKEDIAAWLDEHDGVTEYRAELTRLKEENERLRKKLDAARDWSPEMKAAAMADAQKVCDLHLALEELLKRVEPFLDDYDEEADAPFPADTDVQVRATMGDLRSLAEAYHKAKTGSALSINNKEGT